jgi:hypothetical protein
VFIIIGGMGISTPIVVFPKNMIFIRTPLKKGGQGDAPFGLPPPMGREGSFS